MENSIVREQYIQDQFCENLEKAVQESQRVLDLLNGITGRSTEGAQAQHDLESDLRLAKSYQELLGISIMLLIRALAPSVNAWTSEDQQLLDESMCDMALEDEEQYWPPLLPPNEGIDFQPES